MTNYRITENLRNPEYKGEGQKCPHKKNLISQNFIISLKNREKMVQNDTKIMKIGQAVQKL